MTGVQTCALPIFHCGSINAKPIVTKDFTWDLSYNITWNHNEITKLTGGDDSDYYVEAGDKISRGNNTKVQAHKVGYAANSFYVYQQVYDENGKPIENMFVDLFPFKPHQPY